MADPWSLVPAMLGVLKQTGNIGADAQQYQQTQKQNQLLDLAVAAKQKQAQQEDQYQQDVQSYYKDPTLENLAQLAAKHPDHAAAFKSTYDIMNGAQRQSTTTQMGELWNAAENANVPILKAKLGQLKQAEQRQGIDTSDIDAALSGLDTDPDAAIRYIRGFAQTHLAAAGVKGFQLPGATTDGKVVGNTIGHYEGGKWVVDYSAPDKPQYRSVDVYNDDGDKIGTKLIQVNGGGGQSSGGTEGGDQASGGAGGGNAPRSVRNNNPGNLKASPFTKKLPGYKGTDSGGFAVFDSPESGSNAQLALLKNYRSRGFDTVRKIISRWAPPSDNNDTSAYIDTVAKQLGVNPDDTLAPNMLPRLQSAISRVEGGPGNPSSGQQPQSAQGTQGAPDVVYSSVGNPGKSASVPGDSSLSGDAYLATVPKALATQARALADGRIPLPSSFALSKPYWQKLLQIASQYDPTFDYTTARTRYATRKEFTSGKAASNITSFNTALHHIDVLAHAADDLHNTSFPLWNTIENVGSKATGSAQVDKFNAAKQAVIDELERSFRGTSGTLEGIRGWEKTLNSSSSPAQIKGVLTQMADLLAGRIESLGEQYTQGMGKPINGINLLDSKARTVLRRLGSGYSDVQDVTRQPQRQPPAGFRIVAIDGKPVQ